MINDTAQEEEKIKGEMWRVVQNDLLLVIDLVLKGNKTQLVNVVMDFLQIL